MADKKKKTNYQELSYSELVSRRDELKKKYMEFRFKMVLSHVDNPMEKRAMRKEIARLNTFIHQRDLEKKLGIVAGNK